MVDASSFLGEWPSRRLNGSPPPTQQRMVEQRLRLMDRLGIQRAAVALLDGAWLKDSGVANAELFAMVGQRADRFLPVYTLNPLFPAWAEQLGRCVQEHGLAAGRGAVRLYPSYHGYQLDDPGIEDCLARLAELDLPVVLTLQLEDARMQQPAMRAPDLRPDAIAAQVGRWPQVRWTITGAIQGQILRTGRHLAVEARVWFDIARVQGPIDSIVILREHVGVRRLLFGTNLPLHVAESPIMELADARLTPEEDAAVRHGNARDALGLE